MNVFKTTLALLVFLSSNNSFAAGQNSPLVIRGHLLRKDVVKFEVCQNSIEGIQCDTLGSEQGYSRSDLEKRAEELKKKGNWIVGGVIASTVVLAGAGAVFGFAATLGSSGGALSYITAKGMALGSTLTAGSTAGTMAGGVTAHVAVAGTVAVVATNIVKRINPYTYYDAAQAIEDTIQSAFTSGDFTSDEEFIADLTFALEQVNPADDLNSTTLKSPRLP